VTFLSTRRRHPLAGLVLLLFGLVLAGGLYSAVRPATAGESPKSDTELISEGRDLFVVGCSSCHGMNAEGIETKNGNNYGPPLIGVGAAAVDFQVSTGRMPMARPGAQADVRPQLYSDREVEALAAYVASLGPGPAIPEESAYDISDVTEEEVARGGELFRTNCTACHNFAGQGGALPHGRKAPPIQNVDEKHIYEAMLTGPQQMPVFSDEVLRPEDKRDIIAYVKALKAQPSYGGSSLGSLGPVAEGLWGWVGGMGVLVLVTVWIASNGVRAGKRR